MSYDEAIENVFTREEARLEIAKHASDGGFPAFLAEVGDKPEYSGAEVLGWLGY